MSSTESVNITSIKTASDGVWQGDNPLHSAFPLLIIQATLILIVTRILAVFFKPLRQPKVIAEIVGGIVLGPSFLGRNTTYMHTIFPKWSTPILESVASIGLLFFLFLVGLELDLRSIRRSGRRAFLIALAGITLPFVCGFGVAVVFRKTIDGADAVGYGQFFVFMGVALSITAFPVLARILAELKLLTTQVGQTAMAAAAFNDLAAWILLALAVALAGNGGDSAHQKSPIITLWVLLTGVAFVVFMIVAIRPVMKWVVAKRSSSEQHVVDEAYIALTLTGVLVSGFMTDLIGIHSIFGAFVFGLMIPKEGDFAGKLMERIEDFVCGLLLPLYFASSGLKTNVAAISGGRAWGLLVLVIFIACAGKIFGTFIMAIFCRIPAREAFTLGVLMNTKGLVELIVLNIGRERKVLNDEMFAILVLMALVTTFITTPSVMAIYKPARHHGATHRIPRKLQRDYSKDDDHPSSTPALPPAADELRILACAHGPGNVPALINLIESTRSTAKSQLKLYIMHLVELTERSSSIVMVQRMRNNGLPFFERRFRRGEVHDQVACAFETYGRLGRVTVRPVTAISALSTMHQDICDVAEEKRVVMVIVPFHKLWKDSEDGVMSVENVGHGWRVVNQKVLSHAPCSVGVLVDRGFGLKGSGGQGSMDDFPGRKVCVVFFGGPDDREALELGGRMAEHPAVKVMVIRFVDNNNNNDDGGSNDGVDVMLKPSPGKSRENNYTFSVATMNRGEEKAKDDSAVTDFRRRWEGTADYTERIVGNIVEDVLSIGRSKEYELIVVGKGRFPSTMVAELADRHAEHPELGPIGDILSASNSDVFSSVLVVQQHDVTRAEEVPVSKIVHNSNPSVSTEV